MNRNGDCGRLHTYTNDLPAVAVLNQGIQIMPNQFAIPYVAFLGRTYKEYLEMFSLQESGLSGSKTLDVASGPNSFISEAISKGFDVTGCDPMYATPSEQIRDKGRESLTRYFRDLEADPGEVVFKNYAAWKEKKHQANDEFADHYAAHKDQGLYIYGRMPQLPFPDQSFDRVLSANLLFAYSPVIAGGISTNNQFDLDFHLAAVTDIARVARHEIRLSPSGAFVHPPRPHDYLNPVMRLLGTLGFETFLENTTIDSGLTDFNHGLIAKRL